MGVDGFDPKVKELLLRLYKEGAFEGNAKRVWVDKKINHQISEAQGGVLIDLGLARSIPDSEAPSRLFLNLTQSGISRAEAILESQKLLPRIRQMNWLGWSTLLAAAASAFFAYQGLKQ